MFKFAAKPQFVTGEIMEISEAIRRAGLTTAQVAASVGVSARTVRRWMNDPNRKRCPLKRYRAALEAVTGQQIFVTMPDFKMRSHCRLPIAKATT